MKHFKVFGEGLVDAALLYFIVGVLVTADVNFREVLEIVKLMVDGLDMQVRFDSFILHRIA